MLMTKTVVKSSVTTERWILIGKIYCLSYLSHISTYLILNFWLLFYQTPYCIVFFTESLPLPSFFANLITSCQNRFDFLYSLPLWFFIVISSINCLTVCCFACRLTEHSNAWRKSSYDLCLFVLPLLLWRSKGDSPFHINAIAAASLTNITWQFNLQTTGYGSVSCVYL